MSDPHFRRCWDCGAINRHADSVAPEVCCKRCQSQDTRRMKNEPPLWVGVGSIRENRGIYISDKAAVCPECGASLIAECHEHEAESGRPVATGIELFCIKEMEGKFHGFQQNLWQPVRDAVVKLCDARVDYPSP